jgi:hypothetical protein
LIVLSCYFVLRNCDEEKTVRVFTLCRRCAIPMIMRLKSSEKREDNRMDSGIVCTALTNELPRNSNTVIPPMRERIQALIANDFKRLMSQT